MQSERIIKKLGGHKANYEEAKRKLKEAQELAEEGGDQGATRAEEPK
jgi:hypothetical protein